MSSKHSYRDFVGLEYEEPFGCLRLVQRVYEQKYGINLWGLEEGIDKNDLAARTQKFHEAVARLGKEVTTPQEGDIVLIRSIPWHMGVVVRPGEMLHCYGGGTSTIEDYTGPLWRNRIMGFYRYDG